MSIGKRLSAEFLGTFFLLATVVGSGTLMEKLAQGNVALIVLAVAFATGCVLSALIVSLGAVSAYFNPAVALMDVLNKKLPLREFPAIVMAQIAGAVAGVVASNMMFELPPFALSQSVRTGAGNWLGEVIATFGLIMIIQGSARFAQSALPFTVSAYVAGAILFTSSTCFANPAVTVSRMFTATITGIRPDDVLPYIGFQMLGLLAAVGLCSWLFAPEKPKQTDCRQVEFELGERAKSSSRG